MVQQNESYDELKKLTIAKLKSHTHQLPFHFLFMHSLVRATHQAKFSFWAFLQHSQIDVNFTATFMYFLDPLRILLCLFGYGYGYGVINSFSVQ